MRCHVFRQFGFVRSLAAQGRVGWAALCAVSIFVGLWGAVACAQQGGGEQWNQWRGPRGDGHTQAAPLPIQWTAEDVVWKTDLPGLGQSSPVVWGDRVFLTAAKNDGAERVVFALDRQTGKLLWERTAWTGKPEPSHTMNRWASATCATDGQRVVAFFGRGGLHCFDLAGKPLWSRADLGPFEGPWGTAASPLIVGDLVIQNCDAENDAFLLAVDKETGKTVWQTPRERLRGWSTPLPVAVNSRVELVLNGERGVHGYDLKTGKELWFCKGDRGRGTPTVTPINDQLLVAVSGRPGDMVAMRPGGQGEVNASHEVWRTRRTAGRDLPSPIVVGDYLVVVSLRPAMATCYDARSGEQLDRLRLKGNVSASPIAAGGLIYFPNEEGTTFVLRPGKKLEVVAENQVGADAKEIFRACLTPSGNQLLIRSDGVLYCVGKAKAS